MAGEWLKVDRSTPDKPEVIRMARLLKKDRDLVFGKLLRLWCWFDSNSVDGVVDGVVDADVDDLCACEGFAQACIAVGWMEFDSSKERISLPNFNRHNGETAKQRMLKNRRQARWRANVDDKTSTHESTKASTREEKRREEKEKTAPKGDLLADIPKQIADDFRSLRSRLRAPITQTAMDGIRREAAKANLPVADALAMCCERGWRGFNAAWVNGNAAVNGHVAPQTGTPRQRRELGT
jgi:hypothetical protein